MRWQDLVYLKCRKCSARLVEFKSRSILYKCHTEGCGFIISRRKLADILLDEGHVLRQHLSQQQRIVLAEAISTLLSTTISFTIVRNQEDPAGNPTPYKRVLKEHWRGDSSRCDKWKDFVRTAVEW
jgi:hypothetical protein